MTTSTAAAASDSSRWSAVFHATLVPALLVLAWQAWSLTLAANSPAPAPARVVSTFVDLVATGGLVQATLLSLGRVLVGFLFAMVVGVGLGALMGSNVRVKDNLDPIIESFRPIAPMALLPMAILWFGTGTAPSLFIVAYAAFFPLLLNTIHAVSRVDRNLVFAGMTMGISRPRILAKIILPAALPGVLLGARLAMGVAWTAIIAAELAVGAKSGAGGTSGGIGQMMFVFYAYSIDLNGIVVCMIVVGVVALLIDRIFRFAEHRLMPWRHR